MKKLCLFYLILNIQNHALPVITAKIDRQTDIYEQSIEGYKKSDSWGDVVVPIGAVRTSSSRRSLGGGLNYYARNITDYNLNTAWVPENGHLGIGEYFEFKINYQKYSGYAHPGEFNGVCYLFNGYCKSLAVWKENCRIKKLIVYYNDIPLCYVNLVDTWHFQSFDISKFFKNRVDRKNLHAQYEIKNGDKIRFEIKEIFQGSKFNDVAISEFLGEIAN